MTGRHKRRAFCGSIYHWIGPFEQGTNSCFAGGIMYGWLCTFVMIYLSGHRRLVHIRMIICWMELCIQVRLDAGGYGAMPVDDITGGIETTLSKLCGVKCNT